MKCIILRLFVLSVAAVALIGAPSSTYAAGYGPSGCGAGAFVFSGRGKLEQIISSMLNAGLSLNLSQVSGMTSGTSECGNSVFRAEAEQKAYAYANYGQLQQDIAQGRGERLQTLAYLMGCDSKAVDAFGAAAQKNYSQIFSGKTVDSDVMLERVRSAVQSDAAVASQCSAL